MYVENIRSIARVDAGSLGVVRTSERLKEHMKEEWMTVESPAVPVALTPLGSGAAVTVDASRVVVAGYTGRDRAAVQRHIDELAEIGVAPPERVPMYYPMPPGTLVTDESVRVRGARTSGEAEPVIIVSGGRTYLGIGSDHTDRELEKEDIGASKRVCPKPLGPSVVEVDLASLDWDACRLRSWVDGTPYQEGLLRELTHPTHLLEGLTAGGADGPTGDVVLFGGTVPLLADTFRFGQAWRVALDLPTGEVIEHHYTVRREN